ncbi:ATP-binding protein [Streptomyces sp. MZ04]|uniref:ATP-binding protein n=1 Tax=Streptomyces sp. MZ04 TaxID=2559236 RepID=UPI00107E69FD|nr:ATP-binding protein [Streptomyces sp. MZ04]TGB02619.1 ATP-binding protein [Streptomyces sp. MZ04]
MPQRAQTATPVSVFTQRFSATPRGARLARRLARYHLDEWGVPYGSELSEAAAQIVAELAANAVTHGRVAGRDFELRLTCEPREGGVVRVEVSDCRTESRPPLNPQLPAPDEESGRGLLLVAALASEWGVAEREVGKTVWARLALSE